jgi:hypothetical protein
VKPATGVDLFNVDMNVRAKAVQQEAPLSLFVLSHFFKRVMVTSDLKILYSILQLKSRPSGWLKQLVCDTVLTYKEVICALVPGTSLYPTHHDDF